MLISKTTVIKWNSKIKKHYVERGYEFTKMGDPFEVNIQDLTNGSSAIVKCSCDYCGKEYDIVWYSYLSLKKKLINYDCCGNPECTTKKAQDTLLLKYGTTNVRELDFVNEKIKQTNIERFGCENPFGNKDVQQKIKQHYIDLYGVDHAMKVKEIREKSIQTCLDRYGVECYFQKLDLTGDKNPRWKGDAATTIRDGRELPEYRHWRKSVFDRDYYTCQCCGARNGNGKYIRLEAHHKYNWKDNPDLRYDVDNGITLCQECHLKFHSKYGKKNNTEFQFDEFCELYNKDEEIC